MYEQDGLLYLLKTWMPILNLIMILLTFSQLLRYFKTYPEFGVLVSLITTTIDQLWTFLFFLVLWVGCFSLIFKVLGATFDEGMFDQNYDSDMNDYPKVPDKAVFIMQNLRNSIGDLAPPHYNYWENRFEAGDNMNSQLMILLIWFTWFVEMYVMLIILTNFLIALVSQIYEQIMNEKMLTVYRAKSHLNQEFMQY